MIDPFPNFITATKDQPQTQGFKNLLLGLVTTLRHQTRVKRGDWFYKQSYKRLGFPRKSYVSKASGSREWYKNPIACGLLDGFSGFLDIDFRIHDFFLGRDNARNFLRGFNHIEDDSTKHPFLKSWTEEAKSKFKRNVKVKNEQTQEVEVKVFLPIIPDLSILEPAYDPNPYLHKIPKMPTVKLQFLKKISPLLERRYKHLLKENKIKWKTKMGLRAMGFGPKKLVKKIIKYIEDDLRNAGFHPNSDRPEKF